MRKKNSFMKFVMMILTVGIIAGGGFLYLSPQFEQKAPSLNFQSNGYWNLKDKLKINLSDESGIKYYKITFVDGKKEIILDEKVLNGIDKNIDLVIAPPKLDMFYKGVAVKIKIDITDNSKWDFLNGNSISKIFEMKIDNKKPVANVVNNSRYIKRGGSAVVVVKVKDANLKEAYISFNDKIKFELREFYKKDYFVSLIAWDVHIEDFKKFNLIAIDKAGNKTITKIPLYIQGLKSKNDTIKISENFIENVSSSVLEQSGHVIPVELPKRFIEQNRVLRDNNVNFLRELSIKHMDKSKIDNFKIQPFKRLRGSRTAAGFAEKRSYIFNGEKIDEAWHLGMDWASVKKAPIKSTNPGKVIFNEYLGIYGNTIVIDHKMGLASLYAHVSSSNVKLSDEIKAKKKIAHTGSTGAVMGDHLHFGILVQGIEVNPLEWMDKNWIKSRITKILDNAKKTIEADI